MFSPNLELDLLLEQREILVANKDSIFKEKGQCKETLELSVDIHNLDQKIAVVMEDCRRNEDTDQAKVDHARALHDIDRG